MEHGELVFYSDFVSTKKSPVRSGSSLPAKQSKTILIQSRVAYVADTPTGSSFLHSLMVCCSALCPHAARRCCEACLRLLRRPVPPPQLWSTNELPMICCGRAALDAMALPPCWCGQLGSDTAAFQAFHSSTYGPTLAAGCHGLN